MKNIKELGLELIELEDQVLLVESKVGEGKLNDWVKLSVPKIERVEEWNKDLILFCNKVIASTKPLEGLPLLVIEDEVEMLAEHSSEVQESTYTPQHKITYKHGFMDGYNKSKSTYKFTEEHFWYIVDLFLKKVPDVIDVRKEIQSLTKKELWIEIENYCGSPYTTERCPKCVDSCDRAYQRPKITDGKIKAVWK